MSLGKDVFGSRHPFSSDTIHHDTGAETATVLGPQDLKLQMWLRSTVDELGTMFRRKVVSLVPHEQVNFLMSFAQLLYNNREGVVRHRDHLRMTRMA